MTDQTTPQIDKFKKCFEKKSLQKLKVADWKKIFSKELSQIFTTQIYSIAWKCLYRARPNFDCNKKSVDFFTNSTELWAPPRKKIKSQGRCNIIGQSLLYCSSHPLTTIFETKPDTGTEITIMEYKSAGRIEPICVVGVNDIIKIGDNHKKIFCNHFNNSTKESILLDDMISCVFKSKTENSETFPIYNLTNAVTQIFLHNNKNNFIPKYLIPPKTIGLIYPSVETVAVLGANIVMEPRKVKNKLKPALRSLPTS